MKNWGMAENEGAALLSALIAMSLFGLIALYVSLSATTEVRISDNYEALIQARYAALSGTAHARALLRGLDFDDLLNGPDGVHSTSPDYLASARAAEFRNPFEWSLARFVDCTSPGADVSGRPDDGLLSSGACAGTPGVVLIPATGIPFDGGDGSGVLARYFVKVADNNGEPGETAADPSDDPFHDGDGVILVRSIGIASTFREKTGVAIRRNAVAVFESRHLRRSTFDCGAPLVVLGDAVLPADGSIFEGEGFQICGGPAGPGIAVIDPDPTNTPPAALLLTGALPAGREGSITGDGSFPSIRDISAVVTADRDKSLLLNAAYLMDFVDRVTPQFADNILRESLSWTGTDTPDLGAYDPLLPHNAPGQRPLVTLIQGDVDITGSVSGGGLLVVSGRMSVTGSFRFNGLVLVMGGELDLRAAEFSLSGEVLLAAVPADAGTPSWGVPKLTVGGNARLEGNVEAVRAALRLIPAARIGFREVTSSLDPRP